MLIILMILLSALTIDILICRARVTKPVVWISAAGRKPEKRVYTLHTDGSCRLSRNSGAVMQRTGNVYHVLDNGQDTVLHKWTALTLSDSGEKVSARRYPHCLPVTTGVIALFLMLRLLIVPLAWCGLIAPAYRAMTFQNLDYHWIPNEEMTAEALQTEENIYNVLLIGTDGRGSLSPRSDVMILLSINHETRKISAISLLRDLGIYAYDPSAQTFMDVVSQSGLSADDPNFAYLQQMMGDSSHYRFMKLNETFTLAHSSPATSELSEKEAVYAASCRSLLMNIEYALGIRIDGYIAVDFTAVKELVDAIGGVEVDIPSEEYVTALNEVLSGQNGLFGASDSFTQPGKQTLNGNQALAYLRVRHVGQWSDAERAARQRQFLKLLLKQCALHCTDIDKTKLKQACTHMMTNLSDDDAYMLLNTVANKFYTFQFDQTIPRKGEWDDYTVSYQDGSTISYVYIPPWMTPLEQQIKEEIYQDTE